MIIIYIYIQYIVTYNPCNIYNLQDFGGLHSQCPAGPAGFCRLFQYKAMTGLHLMDQFLFKTVCWAMVCRCSSGDWPWVRSIVCLDANEWYVVIWWTGLSSDIFAKIWSVTSIQCLGRIHNFILLETVWNHHHPRNIGVTTARSISESSVSWAKVGWRSGGFIQLLIVVDD